MRKVLLFLVLILSFNIWAIDYKVGIIYSPSTEEIGFYDRCTGTLLAPNIVLTALHCLMDHSGNIKELDTIQFALGAKTLNEALNTPNKTGVKSKTSFSGFESRLRLFGNGLGPQLFDEPVLLVLHESFILPKENLSLGVRDSGSSLFPIFYSFDNYGEESLAFYIAKGFHVEPQYSELYKKKYSIFQLQNTYLNGASGSPLIDGNKVIGIVTTLLGEKGKEKGFKGILFDQNLVDLFNREIAKQISLSATAYNR